MRGLQRPAHRSLGRPFRQLWLAVMVSSTGDGMFVTAFPLLAATLTRDPVLIAGITIATRLPWLLLSMVTGAIADRMDRRRLMVGADMVRFVIVAALSIVIVTDVVNVWMLYVCAFGLSAFETLHVNAGQAILPALVEPNDLLEGNARFASAQIAAGQFVGPPAGSLLFSAATSLPFVVDAVTFVASAALISSIPDDHQVEPPTTRLRDDIREGLSFVWAHPVLRCLATVLAAVNFFYFSAYAVLVLYTQQRLHSGTVVFTGTLLATAVGVVLSRAVLGVVNRRFGVAGGLGVALWLWALTMVGLALTSSGVVAVGCFVVMGVGNGLWMILNTTMRQQVTPPRLLGRMNAAFRTISWGIVPIAAAFGGVMAKVFGIRAPFVLAGCGLVLIACSAKWVFAPVRAQESAHPAQ